MDWEHPKDDMEAENLVLLLKEIRAVSDKMTTRIAAEPDGNKALGSYA